MIAVFTVLVVLTLSLIIVRIATEALTLTGMSRQVALFQARSAFTTTGFASRETEQIMSHPVRRRIIMLVMLLGNLGVATTVASLMLSVLGTHRGDGPSTYLGYRMGMLAIGVGVLWWIASSRWIDHYMSQVISWALRRWTGLDTRDYASLLHVAGEYAVTEFGVKPGNWLASQTLAELKLAREGILVLGIERADGSYYGAPRGETLIRAGDVVVLYGPRNRFHELNKRRIGAEGDRAHQEAVAEQSKTDVVAEEPT